MGWTAEDVARINAKRGEQLPAHRPARRLTHEPKPTRGHKYRAEPCIVTADLTLFTKADIEAAERLNSAWPDVKSGPLKMRAARAGIVGEWFGSLKEGRRWIELRHMERAGTVRELRRQCPFNLCVQGVKLGCWLADFVYFERIPAENMARVEWREVTEDCKGMKTALYRWKSKHVAAQYGISITET